MNLANKKCIPCEAGTPTLKDEEIKEFLKQIKSWSLKDGHLHKKFKFKDFAEALAFTNAVGAIAEEEGHHPDILLSYGKVKIQLWTHKIDGLTESDFILASKIERCVTHSG